MHRDSEAPETKFAVHSLPILAAGGQDKTKKRQFLFTLIAAGDPRPRSKQGLRRNNFTFTGAVCAGRSHMRKTKDLLSAMTKDDHLALQHVLHCARDSAGAKTRLPLAGEGHPVGSEGGVIIHHHGRSGEMFSRV